MGFGPSMVLAPYGDHWKFMRRLTGRGLCASAIKDMWSSIVSDSRRLLKAVADNPEDYRSSIRL
jgi:hypothetical protein